MTTCDISSASGGRKRKIKNEKKFKSMEKLPIITIIIKKANNSNRAD